MVTKCSVFHWILCGRSKRSNQEAMARTTIFLSAFTDLPYLREMNKAIVEKQIIEQDSTNMWGKKDKKYTKHNYGETG